MPSLDVLQRAFADEIWQQETTNLGSLIADDEIPVQRRLNVYRNNVRANRHSALASTYPVVEKLLGPEYFQYLADAYAKKHPSRSGDVQCFGRKLADFLVDLESVKTLPYLSDVARLEWACSVVSVAVSPISNGLENFETLAPDHIASLRFGARKASRLVRSKYPIFSIWLVNQDTHTGDESVNLDEGAQSVLVVRPNIELELWPLDEAESVFADALIAGNTLSEAVDVVTKLGHDVDLNKLFGNYLRNGTLMFSQFEYQSSCDAAYQDIGPRP